MDAYVIRRLGLTFRDVDWTDWDLLLERVHEPEHEVEVALVGKYIDLPDAYLSVTEALRAGGFHHDAKVRIRWVPSDSCETEAGAQKALGGVDAVLVPGGFGVRGIEGKVGALRWARENLVPTLGICLGLQCMVIEYARDVAGIEGASSTEFDPQTPRPVIATMEEQKAFVDGAGDLGGTMRLGSQRAPLRRGLGGRRRLRRDARRRAAPPPLRGQRRPTARRSRRPAWSSAARTPSCGLVEFVELPRDVHPYYVSTQAHPEFKSRPTRAHPLFAGLIGAAIEQQRAARLVEVERPRHHEHAEAHA